MEEPVKETSKPSVSKMIERAKNIADSNTGVGLNRIQMMRTAMKVNFTKIDSNLNFKFFLI